MRPTKIFIDLDDTLNSFTMPALKKVGCPVDDMEHSAFDPRWGYDIVKAANKLHPTRIFEKAEFWESLTEEFWMHLPHSIEMRSILYLTKAFVGWRNVHVLSSCYRYMPLYTASAKVFWIRGNLPLYLQDQFLIGACKHVCASPESLLIDDCEDNIRRFQEYGGQGVLVPRPWNSMHHIRFPNEWITNELKSIFSERG